MFQIGSFYPNITKEHGERIKRYKENKELFKGEQFEILEKYNDVLPTYQQRQLYVAVNMAGLICKKSADFLFGENALYSAGSKDDSPEQKKLDEWVKENDLNISNYESALSNAYRGDSFYKVRWGQEHDGLLSKELDPFRVIIEAQNAEYVFPETYPTDATRVMAFHIAIPSEVSGTDGDEWILNVESHYPNQIIYKKFRMNPIEHKIDGTVKSWRIYAQLGEDEAVETGVPFPLVVHVPNYSTDDCWTGLDDLTELKPLFAELNTRISQISEILSKHADPSMVVPQGTLVEGEDGYPLFRVGVDKVFEIAGGEFEPKYLTWNGQLEYAFREMDKVLELILMKSEIPAVVLGMGDTGTSGASGLAIKWRMNSLLAKINRKRQYYDKGLRRVLTIAQLLEIDRRTTVDFTPFSPIVKFQDGLPKDNMEQATIMQIRTGAKATISQKRAIMELEGLTEEQAQQILDEIEDESLANAVDPTAFQVNDEISDDEVVDEGSQSNSNNETVEQGEKEE
jgi:hypothetical protein